MKLPDQVKLRELIISHFDEGDLRTLCFDLGSDFDCLRGTGGTGKAKELAAHFGCRGHISELAKHCRRARTHFCPYPVESVAI